MDITKFKDSSVVDISSVSFYGHHKQVAKVTGMSIDDVPVLLSTNFSTIIGERHVIRDNERKNVVIVNKSGSNKVRFNDITEKTIKDLGDFYVYYPCDRNHKLKASSMFSVINVALVSCELTDDIKYIFNYTRSSDDYTNNVNGCLLQLVKKGTKKDNKGKKSKGNYPTLLLALRKEKARVKKAKQSLSYYEGQVEHFKDSIASGETFIETLESILSSDNKGELMLLVKNDNKTIASAAKERLTNIL